MILAAKFSIMPPIFIKVLAGKPEGVRRKGERCLMERKKDLRVRTRKSATRGKFQTDLEPAETLGLDAFAEWWANRSFVKPFEVKRAVELVEGGVLAALKEGCQVNLGLATFYPRLSGALSARDADPETEERFVRGAVKARRTLTHALERHLKAVNSLARARASLYGVTDAETGKANVISAGRTCRGVGSNIQVVEGRDDEGVWLEKKMKRGMAKRARARILSSSGYEIDFVFDETPPSGKYFLVVQSRAGMPQDFRPVRARCEVVVK